MQGMTEWIGCFLSGVTIAHSDFSASYFRSCRQEKVHTEDSRMPESFYAGQAVRKGETEGFHEIF